MPDYRTFFFNSTSRVIQFDLLELSHPNLSQTYYFVRNATKGVTVALETGAQQFFQYRPIRVTPTGAQDDLDQTLQIDLGDLGQILPVELDNVAQANGFSIKPTLVYRAYRSDDLSSPMVGPSKFDISAFSFTREGASFVASAPSLNINKTGEIYRFDRFPMLRAFL